MGQCATNRDLHGPINPTPNFACIESIVPYDFATTQTIISIFGRISAPLIVLRFALPAPLFAFTLLFQGEITETALRKGRQKESKRSSMESPSRSPNKEVKFDIAEAPEDTESYTTEDAQYAPAGSSEPHTQDDPSRQTTDRTLVTTALLYVVMVTTMLIGPIIIYAVAPEDDPGVSSPDYDEMISTLILLFVVGTSAFITALVSLGLAVRRWARLSNASKCLGLFPTICSILFAVALPIWAKIESN